MNRPNRANPRARRLPTTNRSWVATACAALILTAAAASSAWAGPSAIGADGSPTASAVAAAPASIDRGVSTSFESLTNIDDAFASSATVGLYDGAPDVTRSNIRSLSDEQPPMIPAPPAFWAAMVGLIGITWHILRGRGPAPRLH